MKEIAFEGALTTGDNQRYTEINIRLPKTNLTVKGIGRDAMIKNKAILPEEHGVYILEADDICYVGQSQNLKSRLSGHFSSKKINFERVFFLSRGTEDLRDRLDFMEKYLYKRMKDEGYELSNDKELNPDTDILISYKKATVSDWIDEFLLFLPILGFKKTKKIVAIIPEANETTLTHVVEKIGTKKQPHSTQQFNGELLDEQNDGEYFHKNPLRVETVQLLRQLPLSILLQNPSINDSRVQIKDSPFKCKYTPFTPAAKITNIFGEIFYVAFNANNNSLNNKKQKIQELIKIKNEGQKTVSESKPVKVSAEQHGYTHSNPLRVQFVELICQIPTQKLINEKGIYPKGIDIRLDPFGCQYKPHTPAVQIINQEGALLYIAFNINNKDLKRYIKKTIEVFDINNR